MVAAFVRVKRSSVCSFSVCRRSAAIHPEAFVVADGVDDQRVAFPPADGVAVEGRIEIRRMRAAVHVDRPVRVRAADVEDENALNLRQLDELDAVRRQELAHEARRLAARVRLELVLLAIVEQRLRPRLERYTARCDRTLWNAAAAREPHAFILQASRRRAAHGRRRFAAPVRVEGRWDVRGRRAAPGSGRRPAALRHADLDARPVAGVVLRLLVAAARTTTSTSESAAAADNDERLLLIQRSALPLDAASSVSPGRAPVDVSVTLLAFIRLVPFFASEPSTVTESPILSVF